MVKFRVSGVDYGANAERVPLHPALPPLFTSWRVRAQAPLRWEGAFALSNFLDSIKLTFPSSYNLPTTSLRPPFSLTSSTPPLDPLQSFFKANKALGVEGFRVGSPKNIS